jgi:hypothetical protein
MSTAKGDVKRNALMALRDEVTERVLKLPKSEEDIARLNPTMCVNCE